MPAGGFDDHGVGTQAPVALGGLDHRDPDAVLDAAGGVERLELDQHDAAKALVQPGNFDERRVADRIDDAVVNPSHGGRSSLLL